MEPKRQKKLYKHLFIIRMILGVIFLFFGILHLIHPENFVNILRTSRTPLIAFNSVFAPVAEILIGILLLIGLFSRFAGIIGCLIMIMGVWTTITIMHLDPSQLPEGINEKPFHPPVFIPIILAILSFYIALFGCGAWGLDSRSKK